jgi:hypothetical protein
MFVNFTFFQHFLPIIFEKNITHLILNSSLSVEKRLVSKQTDHIVSQLNVVLMFFGIVGNMTCLCVLTNRKLYKKRFNRYLLTLAFVELCFSSIVFANYLIFSLYRTKEHNNHHNLHHRRTLYDLSRFTCYYIDFIVNILDEMSVYLMLLLSIDRLYAIREPIKTKLFVTQHKQKRCVLAGVILIVFFNLPYFLIHQYQFKGKYL